MRVCSSIAAALPKSGSFPSGHDRAAGQTRTAFAQFEQLARSASAWFWKDNPYQTQPGGSDGSPTVDHQCLTSHVLRIARQEGDDIRNIICRGGLAERRDFQRGVDHFLMISEPT